MSKECRETTVIASNLCVLKDISVGTVTYDVFIFTLWNEFRWWLLTHCRNAVHLATKRIQSQDTVRWLRILMQQSVPTGPNYPTISQLSTDLNRE